MWANTMSRSRFYIVVCVIPTRILSAANAKIFLRGTYLANNFAGDFRYLRVWEHGEHGWQIVGG